MKKIRGVNLVYLATEHLCLTTITPLLGELLPLLGSNHDGEVVATARAIGRVPQRASHGWHDLTNVLLPPPAQPEPNTREPATEGSIIWFSGMPARHGAARPTRSRR
jgi:hypothetical protein